MTRKLIVFHTLNDYSGSPKMLATVIGGLISNGWSVDLYTSSERGGCLSGMYGVKFHEVFYKFTKNRIITSLRFIILQFRYFFISLNYKRDRDVIFYLNTILPFGAAIGAKLIHRKIIYHVHENPVRRNIIHGIALWVMLRYADKAFFVSEYLFNSYFMEPERKVLVPNALMPAFSSIARDCKPEFKQPFNILMISSLKRFKGIDIFYELSIKLPQHNFFLVLNANEDEIGNYFRNRKVPGNLSFLNATPDLHPTYRKAHLVLNLSLPDLCIESFGLTILEAMAYGIPVIVPPYGGIAELVEDGINRFKVEPGDYNMLEEKISSIFSDKKKYSHYSANAKLMAEKFSYKVMISRIETVIKEI